MQIYMNLNNKICTVIPLFFVHGVYISLCVFDKSLYKFGFVLDMFIRRFYFWKKT